MDITMEDNVCAYVTNFSKLTLGDFLIMQGYKILDGSCMYHSKMETTIKYENNLENEDYFKNENNLKNRYNLKNADDLKNVYTQSWAEHSQEQSKNIGMSVDIAVICFQAMIGNDIQHGDYGQ